jgi:lipid A 4'-phosphatase
MSKRFFFSVAIITGLFSIAMYLFPQIDLAISGFFYQPERGFLLEHSYDALHLNIFRDTLVYITYGLIAITSLMLIAGIFFKNLTLPLSPKICLFLLLCFAIGPMLIVNDVLKNHWGRARPNQIQQFGGDKKFTPAWVISDQCEKNCSFTSGETANVFCYLALLFIVRRKKLIASVVLAVSALMMFERIAQGDHFFSDALLSGFIDYLLIWLIYQIYIRMMRHSNPLNIRNQEKKYVGNY